MDKTNYTYTTEEVLTIQAALKFYIVSLVGRAKYPWHYDLIEKMERVLKKIEDQLGEL